ncbi:MAG: response regulator [Proteobacteria bacterium]|nr:response regulator [Pseudomonadota bacterium]
MNNRTILLVEDNPKDEMLTLRALGKNHLANEVIVVRDGAEALDYLFATGDYAGRDLSDLPTVVLLDLKLPKIDGLEVLRRIRADERYKMLPVVILTSSDEERDIIAGYELGANSYVRKPVAFADFSRAVADLGRYWLLTNEPPPTGGG